MREVTIVQESSELRDDAFRWSLFTGTHDSITFRPSPYARRIMGGVMAISLLIQAPMAFATPISGGAVGMQVLVMALWWIFYRHDEIKLTQTGLYLRLGSASRNVSWDQVVGVSVKRPRQLVVIVDEGRGPVEVIPDMAWQLPLSFFWLGTPRVSWLTTPDDIPQRFPGFIGEVIFAWARLNRR